MRPPHKLGAAFVFSLVASAFVGALAPTEAAAAPGRARLLRTWKSGYGFSGLVASGQKVFFAHDDDSAARGGVELWASDGTDAGTALVKDVRPGTFASAPVGLVDVQGSLFFRAKIDEYSPMAYDLFRSDGTARGTTLVGAAPYLAFDGPGVALGRWLYLGTAKTIPPSLFRTDGTTFEEVAREGFGGIPGGGFQNPSGLGVAGGQVFFHASVAGGGSGTWATDGATAPVLVAEGERPTGGFTTVGATAYYATSRHFSATTIWKRTGRSITKVSDALDDVGELHALPSGKVLFAGETFDDGRELWATDGTPAGTVKVADAQPGATDGVYSDGGAVLGDALYYWGMEAPSGIALWRSDGTAAGTARVKAFPRASSLGSPPRIVAAGGRVVFAVDDGVHGEELWESDGTEAGTVLVHDLLPGQEGSRPRLAVVGTTVFASAVGDSQLWAYDAPPAAGPGVTPDGGVAPGGDGGGEAGPGGGANGGGANGGGATAETNGADPGDGDGGCHAGAARVSGASGGAWLALATAGAATLVARRRRRDRAPARA